MQISLLIIIIVLVLIVSITIIHFVTNVNSDWQVNYLKKVYPLAGDKINSKGPIVYSNLEFIFTKLLPQNIIDEMAEYSFKAAIPGPSCEQLPCPCINFENTIMPDVNFDPDPIWQKKWPICNLPNGEKGVYVNGERILSPCCESKDSYLKCLKYYRDIGQSKWGAYDTYDGTKGANAYNIPEYNQIWKPSLFPQYTGLISKYPPQNWNDFYNVNGDNSNSWIEVIHSYFSNESTSPACWFYRAKGSGIFLNLQHTFIAKNKISALLQLQGLEECTITLSKIYKFWRGNTVATIFADFFAEIRPLIPGKNDIEKMQNIVLFIDDPNKGREVGLDWKLLYDLNRIANTGEVDSIIQELIFRQNSGIRTVQFTVQPNLYPGWTTEIMYLGDTINSNGGDIRNIPKTKLRILDPSISNNDIENSIDCNFEYPFRFLYCDKLVDTWASSFLQAQQDPTTWASCANI